ncbi:MAG: hypothetical protein WCJ57_02645 [Candidatus Falkowbacteria bacterium]
MKKNLVILATPYRPEALESYGNASYMLIRQFKFPFDYREDEELVTIWSNQSRQYDALSFSKSFGDSDRTFEYWLRRENEKNILTFLKKILRLDEKIVWSGFRVLGTITESGHTLFTFEVFSKSLGSGTKVYTGEEGVINLKK